MGGSQDVDASISLISAVSNVYRGHDASVQSAHGTVHQFAFLLQHEISFSLPLSLLLGLHICSNGWQSPTPAEHDFQVKRTAAAIEPRARNPRIQKHSPAASRSWAAESPRHTHEWSMRLPASTWVIQERSRKAPSVRSNP